MLYHVVWQEFIPTERVNILKDLLGFDFSYNNQDIQLPDQLFSSGEMEAIKFLCDPTTSIKFYILDKRFGKTLLQVHTEFWKFYFNR